MKRFTSHVIGVDQGSEVLFSDFEDDGAMWSGGGPRLSRTAITFSDTYSAPPSVMVSLSMVDMSNSANARVDLAAENVTTTGFDIVFRTWEDSQVARARANWQAIGELPSDDTWDI